MKTALSEVFSLQLLGYSPILVYHCAALCKMYCFNHVLSYFTRFVVLFYINLSKKRVRSPPPHTLCIRPMFWLNKLLKLLIYSFVDISGEIYIFFNNNLDKLKKNKRGLKMPWTKLMQYSYKVVLLPIWISIVTLVQLCNTFGVFNTMRTILPKY